MTITRISWPQGVKTPKTAVINGGFFGDGRRTTGYNIISVTKRDGVRIIKFKDTEPNGPELNPVKYGEIAENSEFFRGAMADPNARR